MFEGTSPGNLVSGMGTLSQEMFMSESSVSDLQLDSVSLFEIGLNDDDSPTFLPTFPMENGTNLAHTFSSTSVDEESPLVAGFPMAESKNGGSVSKRTGRGRKSKSGSLRCMSKNAIAARENREKKKAYISSLEEELKSRTKENERLRQHYARSNQTISKLDQEVQYLRNIISNLPEIRKLVPAIQTAFVTSSPDEYSLDPTDASPSKPTNPAGLCVHVLNGQVSLKFCSICSKNCKKLDNSP